MNIEEGIIKAKAILDNHREIDKMMVIEMVELVETLLTAYEKEKEKNKRLEKFIENGEYTWKQKYNETFEYVKEELEKEKEKNKEYEILLKRQEELDKEKENLIKQGWLNE